jgi:hypothetical protein
MIPNINPKNFVAPAPIPQPTPQPQITVLPRADTLLTRADVMGAHRALLAAYEQQQADIADGWGGDAPSAQRAAQGSSTTGMYLGTTVALTATTTAGIALIAWLAGAGLAWALAGWVAATGIVALLLTRAQHAAELRHSPFGLALLVAEQSYDLLAAAQDGHLAMLAEEREDARAARAAADSRQLAAAQAWQLARQPQPTATAAAADAPSTHSSRRPQHPQQPTATADAEPDDIPDWIRRRPQPPQRAPLPEPTAQPEPQPTAQPEPQPERQPERQPEQPAWAAALLDWAAALHDGGLGGDGLITRATPWAARSPWPAPAKGAMLSIVTAAPALITPAADGKGGGRYRLDTVMAPSSDALLALLTVRLGSVTTP